MIIKVKVIVNNPKCCSGILKGTILSVQGTGDTLRGGGGSIPCYEIVDGAPYYLIEKRDTAILHNTIGGKLL